MKKNKLTLNEIVKNAKLTDTKGFDEYLHNNNISYEVDEMCITDLNEGWYLIRLTDYDNTEITFIDGGFDSVVTP